MIEFQKIRYRNFLSTGNAWTEIDFQATRTSLFVGKNGTGKSAFMDALCYVLFKKPYREINLPQLINSKNGKDLVVELMFKVGSTHYLVRRGMKPAVFDIYCNGTLLNQPGSSKDYQETLEKHILKLNYKSFSQIVILGPAKFKPFMKLAAADRRAVIDDVLDIQVFTVMSVIAKQKLQATKRRIADIDAKADGLVYAKNALQENLAKYKAQASVDTAKITNEIQKTAEAVVFLTKKIKPLSKEFEDKSDYVKAVRDPLAKGISDLSQQIAAFETHIAREQHHLNFFLNNKTCPTCEQKLSEDLRREKKGNATANVLKNQASLKEVTETHDKAREAWDLLMQQDSKLRDMRVELVEKKGALESFKKHISYLEAQLENAKQQDQLIADTESHIGRIDSELVELETEYLSLQEEQGYQEAAVQLLKDSGMKARLLRDYIPVINTQINKYLQALDFYVGFTLDENFNETIKSRFRDEFSYGNFSMGQQMRIDLAMLFTWRDVARMRNSVSTNLLIMDEIFDSSLDGDGTDDFLKIMETVSKETQVFVISHKTEQLLEKFDRVIRFELKKDFTVMG